MDDLVLIGTGPTAKTLLKFTRDYNLYNVIGFAVDPQYIDSREYCGLPVYDLTRLEENVNKQSVKIFVTLSWNRLNAERMHLFIRLRTEGYKCANIISPNAIIHTEIRGTNCWISNLAIIEPNVLIGENTFIKSRAWIGTNSIIHDHCFIGAGSMIAGAAEIGEQSFIGINATIFDFVRIGRKSIIGACTKVKRSLPDFSIVKSTTSNEIIIQSSDKEIENKLLASSNVR